MGKYYFLVNTVIALLEYIDLVFSKPFYDNMHYIHMYSQNSETHAAVLYSHDLIVANNFYS